MFWIMIQHVSRDLHMTIVPSEIVYKSYNDDVWNKSKARMFAELWKVYLYWKRLIKQDMSFMIFKNILKNKQLV